MHYYHQGAIKTLEVSTLLHSVDIDLQDRKNLMKLLVISLYPPKCYCFAFGCFDKIIQDLKSSLEFASSDSLLVNNVLELSPPYQSFGLQTKSRVARNIYSSEGSCLKIILGVIGA